MKKTRPSEKRTHQNKNRFRHFNDQIGRFAWNYFLITMRHFKH